MEIIREGSAMREVVETDGRQPISAGYAGLNSEYMVINHSNTVITVYTSSGKLRGRVQPAQRPKPDASGINNLPYCATNRLNRYGEHILVVTRICNGGRLARSGPTDSGSVALYAIPISDFANGPIYVEEADIIISCTPYLESEDVSLAGLLNRPVCTVDAQSYTLGLYGEHNVKALENQSWLFWHGGNGMVYRIPLIYRPAIDEGVIRVITPFCPCDNRNVSHWASEFDWAALVNDTDGGIMVVIDKTQVCCAVDRSILERYITRVFGVKLVGTPVDPAVRDQKYEEDVFVKMRVASETAELRAQTLLMREENEDVDKNMETLQEYMELKGKREKATAKVRTLINKIRDDPAHRHKERYEKLKRNLGAVSLVGATYMAIREPLRVLLAYLVKVQPHLMTLLKLAP